jgi:hypothetical protein
MGRSEYEIARDDYDDAKLRLERDLHDAVTPGVDAGGLVHRLEAFVDARVRLTTLRDQGS